MPEGQQGNPQQDRPPVASFHLRKIERQQQAEFHAGKLFIEGYVKAIGLSDGLSWADFRITTN